MSLEKQNNYFQWLNDRSVAKNKTTIGDGVMTLSEALKKYLEEKKYTCARVARRIGVSGWTVQKVLKEKGKLSPNTANLIMNEIGVFNCTYDVGHNGTRRKYRKGNGALKSPASDDKAVILGLRYLTVKLDGGKTLLVNRASGKSQLLEI